MKRTTTMAAGIAALALTFGAAGGVSAARPTPPAPQGSSHSDQHPGSHASNGITKAATQAARRLGKLADHFERDAARLTRRGTKDTEHTAAYTAAAATFTDLAAQADALSARAALATSRDELKTIRTEATALLKAAAEARKTLHDVLHPAP